MLSGLLILIVELLLAPPLLLLTALKIVPRPALQWIESGSSVFSMLTQRPLAGAARR
jgi:hypothetical protein